MTALKIIAIILLIFLLIGFLRIGALISFGDELRVRLRVGAIRLTILPGKPKKPKKEKKEKEKPTEQKKKKKPAKKKRSMPKPSLDEIIDLAGTALSALGATARRACKRVRLDPLDATVVFAGCDDPAGAAIAYGAASSAMFTLMPKAEERFYIPDPSLHLRVDFTAESTAAYGQAGVSLRVGDLFAILFTLVIPLLKWYLRFKKAHKGEIQAHKVAQTAPQEETDPQNTQGQTAQDKIA